MDSALALVDRVLDLEELRRDPPLVLDEAEAAAQLRHRVLDHLRSAGRDWKNEIMLEKIKVSIYKTMSYVIWFLAISYVEKV